MALKKTTAAGAPPPAEPVNAGQADALEALRDDGQDAEPAPTGPSLGELEERTVEAEQRAEAAENQVLTLQEEMKILQQQMQQLLRSARQPAAGARTEALQVAPGVGQGDAPVFDESEPYGLVVGDAVAAYVQNGHQFGKDKAYIETEIHRGSPRAFNPRLVGWTKPKPNQNLDALEGFRDQ